MDQNHHRPARGADVEAANEPSSRRLLMSNSTTTTTLTSGMSIETTTITDNNHSANEPRSNLFSSSISNSNGNSRNSIKLDKLNSKGKKDVGGDDNYNVESKSLLDGANRTSNTGNKNSNNNNMDSSTNTTSTQANKSKYLQTCLDNDQNHQHGPNDAGDDGGRVVLKKEANFVVGLKLLAIFSTIYFFMWSSSILSQAFNLTSYHYTGHFIRTSGFLQNPLIGLMVGVITTVIFQSSGAVTSVLVTIVGSGVLSVRQSIPIIMGANLGTSVTNTVVSLIVYRKKQNFEIAMTAGIVHDMYNMMSVVFMLPLELLFHPLEHTSKWMLSWFGSGSRTEIGELQFLSVLVRPLVDAVILIDKEKTQNLGPDVIVPSDVSLVKRCCNVERRGNETICHERCFSLFSNLDFSDNVVCILLLVIAMVTLFTCLVFVVKVTKSLLG